MRLSDLINNGQKISLMGPYGTQVAERVARDITARPQMAAGVLNLKHLGAGCSALLTSEGQNYLRTIALDYLESVPLDQPVVAVTPSFRLPKQVLEAAASVRGVDSRLPSLGLKLCLDSIIVVEEAMQASGRARENTLLAMTVGPPFECYKGELTPADIDNKYHPQVFAAIRFGHALDYILFETVPSLDAAIGAARAFTQAHRMLDIKQSKNDLKNMGTLAYVQELLDVGQYFGTEGLLTLVSSYNHSSQIFNEIKQQKEYVISLCLDKNGSLYGAESLESALNTLRNVIEREKLYLPVGISINCNSPEVTRNALMQLKENTSWIIGIHPNASTENDPRQYEYMKTQQAIPPEQFAESVALMVEKFNLKIIGGCCGTDQLTMKNLYHVLKK